MVLGQVRRPHQAERSFLADLTGPAGVAGYICRSARRSTGYSVVVIH
jgi:hypothetical protein